MGMSFLDSEKILKQKESSLLEKLEELLRKKLLISSKKTQLTNQLLLSLLDLLLLLDVEWVMLELSFLEEKVVPMKKSMHSKKLVVLLWNPLLDWEKLCSKK